VDSTGAAIDVGYGSASQFTREYKRLFGQPPTRYIRSQRNKHDVDETVLFRDWQHIKVEYLAAN
jgi:AraC-like DNA-binding protein